MSITAPPADLPGPRAIGQATPPAETLANPLGLFRVRKDRAPTRLGAFVRDRMSDLGMTRQADLARATGLSESTVHRVLFNPEYTPDKDSLRRLAEALRVDAVEFLLFAYDLTESVTATSSPNPLAAELDAMLASESPLEDADRSYLGDMVNRLVDPYRRAMRRRRSA